MSTEKQTDDRRPTTDRLKQERPRKHKSSHSSDRSYYNTSLTYTRAIIKTTERQQLKRQVIDF